MPDLFFAGVVLGLASGMSPGPLLTLVFVESLAKERRRHPRRSGYGFHDAPIIVETFWIVANREQSDLLG
jgi:hypothetical protein